MADRNRAFQSNFSGFPVINEAGNLVGIIPRRFLGILIEKHEFTLMSAQNYDMKNMRSANALLYLSPQEDRRMVSAPPMHDEEDD